MGELARAAQVLGAIASALVIGGCSMLRGATSASPPPPAAARDSVDVGQQATLRAIGGSAVSGKIRVIDRGDGAMVLVSIQNLPTREYRIAFHETPNCSSPNGFSAGRAWAPAAVGRAPQELVPIQYASAETGVDSELRVAGLRATGAGGVAGRSVVLYAGRQVTEARPDVPNAAVACGVFQPARPLAF